MENHLGFISLDSCVLLHALVYKNIYTQMSEMKTNYWKLANFEDTVHPN